MGNLSTCADDIRNVRYFQKVTQGYLGLRAQNENSTNSSSSLSFESATSSRCLESRCLEEHEEEEEETPEKKISGESDDFQSAEDILDTVLISAGCADFFNTKTSYLETHFDQLFDEPSSPKVTPIMKHSPQLLSPSTPQDVDPDVISNFAIDLNLDEVHRSMQFTQATSSKTASVDSGSTCRTPSEIKNVTFNPQVINIDTNNYCNLRSPEVSPTKTKKSDRWHLLPIRNKNSKNKKESSAKKDPVPEVVPKTILRPKRRNSEDECFSRTEALPLLSGLSGVNFEKTSPSFVRRKTYVYPAVQIVKKGESSV